MGDVIEGPFVTYEDIPVDGVIDGAKDKGLRDVVVIGVSNDDEFYLATSSGATAEILYLIKRAEIELLRD